MTCRHYDQAVEFNESIERLRYALKVADYLLSGNKTMHGEPLTKKQVRNTIQSALDRCPQSKVGHKFNFSYPASAWICQHCKQTDGSFDPDKVL